MMDALADTAGGTPRHVAIVMDGNRRWAKMKGLPLLMGHKKGTDVARAIVKYAAEIGISYITLYTFSSENWNREPDEVSGLMGLLSYYLEHELKQLKSNDVRLRVIGERDRLPSKILKLVEKAELETADNKGITLIMALSYGSRAEIIHGIKAIAEKVKDGSLALDHITEDVVSQHLYTRDIPDPGLFIRTSGEQRISNYLLWQMSYTELFFTPKYWPDFTTVDFQEAIDDYQGRNRSFGAA